MSSLIIIVAVFVCVASLVGGVATLFRTGTDKAVEDRLSAITAGRSASNAASVSEGGLLSHPLDDVPHFLEKQFARLFNVRLLLDQGGMDVEPVKFISLSLGLAGGSTLLWFLFAPYSYAAPLVGVTLGILPLLYVIFKRKSRLKKFGQQLPEALELISRALRAGHSLPSGFHLVAEQMPDPIGGEFTRCYEEQNLGIPLEEALDEMTNRVPNVDLRFFVTAVILQRQTGGDLAEILNKIGRLIRERFQIWGQIQALTGEGRLSGIVLLALPPVLFGVMLKLNYDYVMMLFNDPLGQKMLAAAIVMQILGALVIRKIVNIKV